MAYSYSDFAVQLATAKAKLSLAEENNKKRESLVEQNILLTQAYNDVEQRLSEMKILKKHIGVAIEKYSDRAIAILTQDIQNALYLVFPDEDFKVRIQFLNSRGNINAYLQIGKYIEDPRARASMNVDEDGYYWDIPQLQNGSLFKQVVSFASQVSIIQMLGGNCIMLDEAFSKGDSKSLAELSPYLTTLYNNGFQILGIEHKSEIYDMVPHKQYKFMKDRIGDKIKIASISEVEGIDMSELKKFVGGNAHNALKQLQSMPGMDTSIYGAYEGNQDVKVDESITESKVMINDTSANTVDDTESVQPKLSFEDMLSKMRAAAAAKQAAEAAQEVKSEAAEVAVEAANEPVDNANSFAKSSDLAFADFSELLGETSDSSSDSDPDDEVVDNSAVKVIQETMDEDDLFGDLLGISM